MPQRRHITVSAAAALTIVAAGLFFSSRPAIADYPGPELTQVRSGRMPQDVAFQATVVSQVNGLRVRTDLPGGAVASFAAKGDFQLDAPSVPGGRFAVTETGQVGIGTATPSSQLHVRAPASGNPISAMSVDVASFSTVGNAQASHFFRVRDMGANAFTAFMIRGDGNVGIGTTGPVQKLTVAGTVRSTSGGFKFPDGSVQTTAGTPVYVKNCFGPAILPTSPQSMCSNLNVPNGTYLTSFTMAFLNNALFFNTDRHVQCAFSGESLLYGQDIAGQAFAMVTLHSVLTVTSGGIDVSCSSSEGVNDSGAETVLPQQGRLTATRLNGSVAVQ